MTVEVTSVQIGEEKITIKATAIENLIMADDLFEDAETPEKTYEFDRKAKNGAEMKYLYKICQSKRKCQSALSMGEKLDRLLGELIVLSDNFLAKAK